MANEISKPKSCSWIDGVGSSEAIDTAGEIVSLAGIDCSSLIGGAFNWEHKSDLPAQIVGKILEYKKIFSEKDCENDRHKHYWDKTKTPFLYVMGRLFDDKKPSAVECAALFQDDAEHPEEHPMVGLSIEGSRVSKSGIVVEKSIARKMTITGTNANKQCVAELIPAQNSKESAEDSIFKSEPSFCIEVLSKAQVPGSKYPPLASVKPKESKPAGPQYVPIPTVKKDPGKQIGTTKSGKPVMSHLRAHDYKNMSGQEHKEAADFHFAHAEEGKGIPGASHFDTAKKHLALAGREERHNAKQAAARSQALRRPDLNVHRMNKALSAGSGMASPGNLVGGAALQKESLEKPAKKKHKWLARAEEEYHRWEKREAFEKFMSKKMPHLHKGEIEAIGRTLCLSKAMKAEKQLADLVKPKKKS